MIRIEEFYQRLGSEYDTVIKRFCNNEPILLKFVRSFPNDPTFGNLKDAVARLDYSAVENSAHALKGVSANLGFNRLMDACAQLVLCVRQEHPEDIPLHFETAQKEYGIIIDEIQMLD